MHAMELMGDLGIGMGHDDMHGTHDTHAMLKLHSIHEEHGGAHGEHHGHEKKSPERTKHN